MFKVNPKVYASMFSLPTEIIDKGLKFASGEQIKVTIAFPEQLIGVMLDRFGKEVSLKKEKDGRYSIDKHLAEAILI